MQRNRRHVRATTLMVGITLLIAATVCAHNAPWPRAKVTMDADRNIHIALRCDVTAYVMQTAAGHLPDDVAGQMEAMTADEFNDEIARRRQAFASSMLVNADGRFIEVEISFPSAEVIRKVNQAPGGPVETIQSVIKVIGRVPDGAKVITLSLPAAIGSVILTAGEGDAATVEVLPAGQLCLPIMVPALKAGAAATDDREQASTDGETAGGSADGATADVPREVIVAGQFVGLGFWHIVPEGLDHILFVLGLFLLSTKMKPLIWQVTAFTVAHSLTLALVVFGVVKQSPEIVEPLIAASIAYVAIENLVTKEMQPWRPAVVFALGLLHGLGFAGAFGDLKLPQGQSATALIGFNIGVEFGQLAVIGAAFLLVGWFRHLPGYRKFVVIPGSLVIGFFGLYWTITRIAGA